MRALRANYRSMPEARRRRLPVPIFLSPPKDSKSLQIRNTRQIAILHEVEDNNPAFIGSGISRKARSRGARLPRIASAVSFRCCVCDCQQCNHYRKCSLYLVIYSRSGRNSTLAVRINAACVSAAENPSHPDLAICRSVPQSCASPS